MFSEHGNQLACLHPPQQKRPLSPLHEPLHWRAKRGPKAEMLSLQSFLRKGMSLGYVGRNFNLKDLKDSHPRSNPLSLTHADSLTPTHPHTLTLTDSHSMTLTHSYSKDLEDEETGDDGGRDVDGQHEKEARLWHLPFWVQPHFQHLHCDAPHT